MTQPTQDNQYLITIPMDLRLFVKGDPTLILVLLQEHFGKGDALVGSGYAMDVAGALAKEVLIDIKASSEQAALQLAEVMTEVDIWRNDEHPITVDGSI